MSQDGDTGYGYGFDYTTRVITAIFVVNIVSFLVIFVAVVFRITNEILIARRCIMWARISLFPILVCHCIMINMEGKVTSRIEPPHLGIVRPAIGLVLLFLAFFISSHPVFRWLVVVLQPFYVVSDVYSAASLRVEIACREAGTCLKHQGYSLQDLKDLEGANYAACFFQLWLILIAAYLLYVMGWYRPRYPVRLFSVTKPLSTIPGKQKRTGFAALASATFPPTYDQAAQAGAHA